MCAQDQLGSLSDKVRAMISDTERLKQMQLALESIDPSETAKIITADLLTLTADEQTL